MMMKYKTKYILLTSAIFLVFIALFDTLCFWLVKERSASFYISVGFANGSILVYGLSTLLSSFKGRYFYLSVQDGFVIGGYTGVCVVLNFLFIMGRMNSVKTNILINVLLLGVYLIVLLVFLANTTAITAQLEYDRKERNAFYELKDKAETLLNKGQNLQINKKLESLYDKISSCQIDRKVNVSDLDGQILSGLNELSVMLAENDSQEVVTRKIAMIAVIVDDRNRRITNYIKR